MNTSSTVNYNKLYNEYHRHISPISIDNIDYDLLQKYFNNKINANTTTIPVKKKINESPSVGIVLAEILNNE